MQRYKKPIAISLVVILTAVFAILGTSYVRHNLADAEKLHDTQTVKVVANPPTASELLRLVNEERAKVGVAPLVEDSRLDQSAQFKADKMQTTGIEAHKDPTTGKNDGLDYLNSIDDSCVNVSENLYWGNTVDYPNTTLGVLKGWTNSKPHYDAMVNAKYSLTGFGVNGVNVVEHFCQTQ